MCEAYALHIVEASKAPMVETPVVIKYMHIYFISIVKEKGTNKKRERRYSSRIDERVAAHTQYTSIRL